ncbi:hypothetical protein AGMMS50212_03190 [Spirochaetia bacterium]|nr:hypothetical protein AGMMS50212_03190 [Spirochaetia bacterium]
MNNKSVEILKKNVEDFLTSIEWLKRSYEKCKLIGLKPAYVPDELDQFEALSSRYARTTDLLINKILRSIDTVEFADGGSILDVVNRAEQRGIIDSVSDIRDIKDLRNEIAHEYNTPDIQELFKAVFNAAPKLLVIMERVVSYCAKYL